MTGPSDDATEAELRWWVAQLSAHVDRRLDDLDRRARAAGYWPVPGGGTEVDR